MRLNEQEIQMFKVLRKSELGSVLARYIERLEADICDIRKFGEHDSIESAQQAATRLAEMRKHLTNSIGTGKTVVNEFH